jgi:hypothetical protein
LLKVYISSKDYPPPRYTPVVKDSLVSGNNPAVKISSC